MKQLRLLCYLFLPLLIGCVNYQKKIIIAPIIDDNTPRKYSDSDSLTIFQNNINEITQPVYSKKENYQPSENIFFDLIHTKLNVRFNWEKQYLYGTATLTFKPHFYKQNQLILDAKGFEIESIKMMYEKKSENDILRFSYDNKKIVIDLGKYFLKNEIFIVEIKYIAKPNLLPKGGSQAITSDIGLYFINPEGKEKNKPKQIWTQGETQASSCWFPTIDAPNQRCTEEIFITVDKKYSTLSNGLLISSKNNIDGSRTDYWKQSLPHAPYLFMIAVGEFEIIKDKWNGIEVNYYVEKEFKPFAKKIFGNTPEMIDFFSHKLNYSFPWAKYSQIVVRDYVSGAMENTTATLHSEEIQTDSRSLLDENKETVIAHELFHHWFGDLVTCESWANLPLNESFANYGEYLWLEHKYGNDDADYHNFEDLTQYLDEALEKQELLIRYYYRDKEDMFDHHSYEKGGRVLHMLRKHVGDEAFFESLNLYLKKNKFKSVEIHDLRLAFEEITGEDLNWFFNQWFLSPGHPILEVNQTFKNGKIVLHISQKQDTLTTTIFRLPLKIEFFTEQGKQTIEREINKFDQIIEINSQKKPEYILIDPNQDLLVLINHKKSISELIAQFKHTEKGIARSAAVIEIGKILADSQDSTKMIEFTLDDYEAIQKLFLYALDDKFWKIREQVVSFWEGYSGPYFNKVQQKLIDLALKDPKSIVRASSIRTLSTFKGIYYKDIYEKGMNDSSYTVNASALEAFIKSKGKNIGNKISRFKNSNNINLIIVLADYFTSENDKSQFNWFKNQISKARPNELYILIQYFGRYLLLSNNVEQDEGVKILEKLAFTHSASFIKISSQQTLELLSDLPRVKEILEKLKTIK